MQSKNKIMKRSLAFLVSVSAIASVSVADAAPRKTWKRVKAPATTAPARPVGVQRATSETVLSMGRGQLVNLPAAISDVFVANDGVADVQVRSPRQLYIFGKSKGETSVYATNASGAVVYSTNIRVAQNINSLDQVLRASFPDSDVSAYEVGQSVVLVGTVLSPDESVQAEAIAKGASPDTVVINRLKMATPMQVSLQVRIAEVNRTFSKEINANIATRDVNGSGIAVGVSTGRSGFATIGPQDLSSLPQLDASSLYGLPAGSLKLPFDPVTGQFIRKAPTVGTFTAPGRGLTGINGIGRLLGLDVAGALDLGETEGLVTMLATPTLTALSGQQAEFVVGGEIPIPVTSLNNGILTTSVEYRSYGVKLKFTPQVQSDGRITVKVAPEVSDLDYSSAVTINGSVIPGLATRRADTMVELGSGQSFVIGGLMKSFNNSTIAKTPGVGDVPILGTLFRSNAYKRGESELMIVVTPYLVKGVSADKIVLPTDGYKAPTELGRIFNGELYRGESKKRPTPTLSAPQTVTKPSLGASASPNVVNPTPGFSN